MKSQNLLVNCTWHALFFSLSACTVSILNERYCRSQRSTQQTHLTFMLRARACWPANSHRLCNIMFLTLFTFSGTQTEHGQQAGLKFLTNPSSHHADTHNNKVLSAGLTCQCNCCRKPTCTAVIT